MKVDHYLPPVGPKDVPDLAARAARLGFDGIFSAETSHDPFLALVAAAPHAPGLDLGTAIAVAFPRSPTVTAMIAWDLADLTGGRFLLGLGTQVRAHIVRRFAARWEKPGPQLREYILAMRAVWESWQHGVPLRFEGEYYQLSLMTPFFNPGPIAHPDIPVYIAGVNPYMARLAGELCQGLHVHPFHTVRYLDEVVLPNIAEGAAKAGRTLADVERVATVFVVTGRTEEEMEASKAFVRQQVAFYASTPTYRRVLETHGWDFGPTLTAMSKRGEWAEMAEVIPDDVVEEVAVVAPFDELGEAIRARYGDRIQRVGYYTFGALLAGLDDDDWARLIGSTRG